MKAEYIIDAVAETDPAILDSIAKQRYKRINISKNNTVLVRRIAAVAAAAVISTTALCVAVPVTFKKANENNYHSDRSQPFITPTLDELYNVSPYDVLLPRDIPEGYSLVSSHLTVEQTPYLELSFGDGKNGFDVMISKVGTSVNSTADMNPVSVIKAADLLNEGSELLKKTTSETIMYGDYFVEYDRLDNTGFSDKELYDMITSSYIFPLTEKSEEWKSLTSVEQMVDAYQIPDDIIKNMTTRSLVNTIMENNFLKQYFAYDNGIRAFDAHMKSFNIYKELFNRADCAKVISDIYSECTVDCDENVLTPFYLEEMIAYMIYKDYDLDGVTDKIISRYNAVNATRKAYPDVFNEYCDGFYVFANHSKFNYGQKNTALSNALNELIK